MSRAPCLLVALLLGCTGEFIITENNCSPGTDKPCVCQTGEQGAQVCANNGWYYEKCECDRPVELTTEALAGVWHLGDPGKATVRAGPGGEVEGGWFLLIEEGPLQGGRWPIVRGAFEVTDAGERAVTLELVIGGLEDSDVKLHGLVDDAARVFVGRPEDSEDSVELRRVRRGGSGWRCHPDWIGADDGCDCGCGAADEGCDAGACDWCFDEQGKVASCP